MRVILGLVIVLYVGYKFVLSLIEEVRHALRFRNK
jgi:hypothetical protein